MLEDVSNVINGATGKIGVIHAAAGITFEDIFDGIPQYYPGSTVQVQETLRINVSLDNPQLVGRSEGWFNTVLRLGTYQILLNGLSDIFVREGDSGYLTCESFEISRISSYTITANPDVLVAKWEQIALDSCNLYLVPEVYLFPDNPVPQPGYKLYEKNPALLGSMTLTRANLLDRPFSRQIQGVGLSLAPGVVGINTVYKVAVINAIYADYPAAQVPSCQFLAADCQTQFNAFLVENSGGFFETQAECESVTGTQCFPADAYVCPTDPTFTRSLWFRP